MGTYLIDTNAVIDFFNGSLPLKGQQLLAAIVPAISVITYIELFSSAKLTAAKQAQLQKFVQMATVYDTISQAIVVQTISIRQQRKIKIPDAIIAATALVNGCTLITRNVADFRQVDNLQIIDPHFTYLYK